MGRRCRKETTLYANEVAPLFAETLPIAKSQVDYRVVFSLSLSLSFLSAARCSKSDYKEMMNKRMKRRRRRVSGGGPRGGGWPKRREKVARNLQRWIATKRDRKSVGRERV